MDGKEANELDETQEKIHGKGFDMVYGNAPTDYNKVKIGLKTVEDATIQVGALRTKISGPEIRFADKRVIMTALAKKDIKTLRAISRYFYRTSGIYQKVCDYYAQMYRWDWYIVPEIYDQKLKEDKILEQFNAILNYLDNSYIKKMCYNIARDVIVDGCYLGAVIEGKNGILFQKLPIDYCRVRWYVGNLPAVEFNMRWFDVEFPDPVYRLKILKMFPPDFLKGYTLYKEGKLPPDPYYGAYDDDYPRDYYNHTSEYGCWYLLEPGTVVKFSLREDGNNDLPFFVNAIPNIIDLDEAQGVDRQKQLQQLMKILVQKLPINKNGDLIFDVDEARDIHNNAVAMLQRAIGVDILTTFADIDAIDLNDTNASEATDQLERVERTVYNALGVSKNLFNTDGNLSLEKSILADEGSMRTLLLQFTIFFDKITQKRLSDKQKKKLNFRLYMLETTQYNYKELSKMYKEQVQIGYSKMLPQIALGHSQSSIVNTAFFENNVLHLSEIMIPPLTSSTMSSTDILGNKSQSSSGKSDSNTEATTGSGEAGRPEKAESEKSDKTLANEESKS